MTDSARKINLPLPRPTLNDARRQLTPGAESDADAAAKLAELERAMPPHGASHPIEWPGGTARVTVDGHFPNSGGVSTLAELYSAQRLPDGRLDTGRVVESFRREGEFIVNLPPAVLCFHGSGPDGWNVAIELQEVRPPSQGATVEQRLAALELGAQAQSITSAAVN